MPGSGAITSIGTGTNRSGRIADDVRRLASDHVADYPGRVAATRTTFAVMVRCDTRDLVASLRQLGAESGPDPKRTSYGSFFSFKDPDGNTWLVQEVTTRLPGRI